VIEDLFSTTTEQLPATLPIFPLSQAVLLPRQQMPLNIFEPRYLNLIQDALGAGRLIGMVQPLPGDEDSSPVYEVGCAGRIVAFQEATGGRLLIQLMGVCRFRRTKELEPMNGYRRVATNWQPYLQDLSEPDEPRIGVAEIEPVLRKFAQAYDIEIPWDGLAQVEPANLIDLLSTQLPLDAAEKQALLEAPTVPQRAEVLLSVLAMPVATNGGDAVQH
jgi:Lon protease-like protein